MRLLHQLLRPSSLPAPAAKKTGWANWPAAVDPGSVTDLAAILDRAAATLQRRSLVFIVSDFISESDWSSR